MTSAPQYFEYSVPPSPAFPPVPRVSPASSVSSLHSLYESDGRYLHPHFKYTETPFYEYIVSSRSRDEEYLDMSKANGQQFTDDDLAKAFRDRATISPRGSPGSRLVHDIHDPQSPWKRSIRLRYSDVNMRDSNALALQEASDLLSRDMASYVNSDEESVEKGSPLAKISPAAASAALNARLQEALDAMDKSTEPEANDVTK